MNAQKNEKMKLEINVEMSLT